MSKFKIQDGEGDAGIRVATLNRYHQDDLEGECSECGRPIFYRPEPPFIITFLCLECAMPLITKPTVEFAISTKTAAVAALLKMLERKGQPPSKPGDG